MIEVKGVLLKLMDRVSGLERAVIELSHNPNTEIFDQKMEDLKECVSTFLYSEEEYSPINRLHDKLDVLVEDTDQKKEVSLAIQTLDKFEDYMKNIDKLNMLVNEFKGCVTLARGAIAERKQLEHEVLQMKRVADISQHIHKSMLAFIKAGENIHQQAHFKIDAIYKAVCEKQEKKSPKRRKRQAKKAPPASQA